MITRISLLTIFTSFSLLAYSQNNSHIDTTSSASSLGFRFYAGTIIPHEAPLRPLKKGIVKAFELKYRFIRTNSKTWQSDYNYPEVGLSYMFMDLGYKKVLGNSHSIYPYIIFPLRKLNKTLNLSIRIGIGLSYNTRLYDSVANPKNIAISTPINLYALLGINLNYKLSSKISLDIGINGSHLSNGSIKKPNYGLNILTGSIGLNYNFNRNLRNTKQSSNLEIDKSRWLASLSGGIKETKDPGGSKYGIGSLSIEYSKQLKTLFRYGTAIDYMFDGSTLKHFELDSINYHSQLLASKLGLTIMFEMSLYRLSAFANLGVYIYNHDKQNSSVYQRIGLRYQLSKIIYTQIALKTHLNVADYIELGVMISIRRPRH